MTKKKIVRVINLSSCEGCTMELLNAIEEITELTKFIELQCRLIGKVDNGRADIALVEGAVISKDDIRKIKEARKKSSLLIAMGDCACSGGKFMFKDDTIAKPIDHFVSVDFYIRGCPANREEITSVLKLLLIERSPPESSRTVCSECILNNRGCLLEKGILCLGPLTRGGCNAICIVNNRPCLGCRGLSDDANIEMFLKKAREMNIEVPKHIIKILKSLR